MRRRLLLALAGVGAIGLADAIGSGQPFVRDLGAAPLVAALGNDYLLLAAIGAAALAVALPIVATGRAANLVQTEMPEPERPVEAPPPGDALDDRLSTARATVPVVGREDRDAVRERLRTATVEGLVAAGLSAATAERAVAEGTWTDDALAAGFLRGEDPNLVRRLGYRLVGDPWLVRAADRTAAAVESASATEVAAAERRRDRSSDAPGRSSPERGAAGNVDSGGERNRETTAAAATRTDADADDGVDEDRSAGRAPAEYAT